MEEPWGFLLGMSSRGMVEAGSAAQAVGTRNLLEETHTGWRKEGKALPIACGGRSQLLGCPGGAWGCSVLASSE